MIGILLLSHGNLSKQLLDSTAMISGKMERVLAVALEEGESPDVFGERVKQAVNELDDGKGVLVLVDLLGGTPYNQIGLISKECNVEIITGMNMPMLMHLSLEREANSDISALAQSALEFGRNGIRVLPKRNQKT
ncbi:PTS sugar transporter subunit IIA [Niallia sp.]|uniref:PTS sugar transporter subunit IIA n=1 Tax=Niallia sp. TaxID=2837523 RepID=UPI00289C9AD1|nr:PTS sugar transporter subunit IIA [Niallia sp.]